MTVHREIFLGGNRDLATLVKTHLFIVGPNNSGTTFLKNALAKSGKTWNLANEGQNTFGFAGPSSRDLEYPLLWSTRPDWVTLFQNKENFNWSQIRSTWYFQAGALDPLASIFVEKSPPFLLCMSQLVENFPNPKFLFMVRNPYATAEGIVRRLDRSRACTRNENLQSAAQHLVNCFRYQKENSKLYSDLGLFFTYEEMCDRPSEVEEKIQSLVPEIDDLSLEEKVPVKGIYNEMLRNMNTQQIERLSDQDYEILYQVFTPNARLFEHFGYRIDPARSR